MSTRTALASVIALVAGIVLMLALHVVPPTSEIDPVRRTISQYALGPAKWVFDVSVLLIALGSALAFAVFVRDRGACGRTQGRCCSVRCGHSACWRWSCSPRRTGRSGPSIGGIIHRYASAVGFVSLPLAVFLVAHKVFPTQAGWRWAARAFGALSLGTFGLIVIGVVRMALGYGPWWRFVPLGLVERAVAFTAVAAILTLVLVLARAEQPRDAVPVGV
jgi:hypothetical protein